MGEKPKQPPLLPQSIHFWGHQHQVHGDSLWLHPGLGSALPCGARAAASSTAADPTISLSLQDTELTGTERQHPSGLSFLFYRNPVWLSKLSWSFEPTRSAVTHWALSLRDFTETEHAKIKNSKGNVFKMPGLYVLRWKKLIGVQEARYTVRECKPARRKHTFCWHPN